MSVTSFREHKTQHKTVTFASTLNLFAMNTKGSNPDLGAVNDDDHGKLLATAGHTNELQETPSYCSKQQVVDNSKDITCYVVDAVRTLIDGHAERNRQSSAALPRDADRRIDSTDDECLLIVKREAERCLKTIKEKQEWQKQKSQESLHNVSSSRLETPGQVQQKFEESQNKEEWEDKLEGISASYEAQENTWYESSCCLSASDQFQNPLQDRTIPQYIDLKEEEEWENALAGISESWNGPTKSLDSVVHNSSSRVVTAFQIKSPLQDSEGGLMF